MNNYDHYANMSKDEKDRLCEHGILREIGGQTNTTNSTYNIINKKSTLKRTESKMDESQDDSNDIQEIDKDYEQLQWRQQQHNRNKRMNKAPRTDSFVQGRTITSSSYVRSKVQNDARRHLSNEERERRTVKENDNYQLLDMDLEINDPGLRIQECHRKENADKSNEGNGIIISQRAMKFAVEEKFPPIKIQCVPTLKNEQECAILVKGLLNHIEINFKKINPRFKQPLGFEHYMIDKNGDVLCFINTIELFIFMCDVNNYPDCVNSIKIQPSLPSKLPARNAIIIKFIDNNVSIEEVRVCVKEKLRSVYMIQEMLGTITYRSRHVRIDLLSMEEYNSVLNSGKFVVKGHLYDVDEYLPSPKILICNKCNTPGHVKNNCKSSMKICRRCGKDRNDGTNHKACHIKCHHYNGEHEATSYKCPTIMKFREELMGKLKKNTHLLPPHLQFYIPQQFRDQKGAKLLRNNQMNGYRSNSGLPEEWIKNNQDINVWPTLNPNARSSMTIENSRTSIWNGELKNLQEELQRIKQENEVKMKMIKEGCEKQTQKMIQGWHLINIQIKTQAEAITDMYNVISDALPPILQSIQIITQIIKGRCSNGNNDEERKQEENTFISINDLMNTCNNRLSLLTEYQQKLKLLMIKQNDLLLQEMEVSNTTSNDQ